MNLSRSHSRPFSYPSGRGPPTTTRHFKYSVFTSRRVVSYHDTSLRILLNNVHQTIGILYHVRRSSRRHPPTSLWQPSLRQPSRSFLRQFPSDGKRQTMSSYKLSPGLPMTPFIDLSSVENQRVIPHETPFPFGRLRHFTQGSPSLPPLSLTDFQVHSYSP